MKKYLGAILSAISGISIFVLLCIANFAASITILNETETETITGWEVLQNKDNAFAYGSDSINGYGLYRIATIVAIVVAVLLIITAIVLMLKNLKVIKVKSNLNLINIVLLTLFAISVIVSLIALFIMGGDMSGEIVKCSPAIGAWLYTMIGVVACAGGWIFTKK